MTELINNNSKAKDIIAALFMVADEPLSVERLHKIFGASEQPLELAAIRDIIGELIEQYANSGVELKEVASGWRLQVKTELSWWVHKLHEERPPRYSRAFMEVLALIVYRQPITRAEIEDVRGVAVSANIIKTLLEHEWIRIVGHKEVPGRPALFATTKKFLDHFDLQNLEELPPLQEFTADQLSVTSEETVEDVSSLVCEST